MATPIQKSLVTSRALSYTYYVFGAHPPSQKHQTEHSRTLPTILLYHGFPDAAEMWFPFIQQYLVPAGFNALAIDCLGYAGSAKPRDTSLYINADMTADVCEILDAEHVDRVVVLGHDWGSMLAQRFYNYCPNRTLGLIMVNVAYVPPTGGAMDIDAMNAMTVQAYGYGVFHYIKLFSADDGAQMLDDHLESFWDVLHGAPETWRDIWCEDGAMREFLLADKRQQTEAYATEQMRSQWLDRFRRDGFDGPLRWYRASVQGLNGKAERDRGALENVIIQVPTLFVGASRDVVCRTEDIKFTAEAGLIPQLTVVSIEDAGHWCMLAKPQKFGEEVSGWLNKTFGRAL